ncbi:6644_t:CDS:2 [Paraglomus brasilianum]|uniref:6644_t:CDS:1 n=1 Tax=Paraglomus brasilianum TaxID=144538 RepID=A0A9N8YZS1_9GLOM|nr:6644_t:CDS:2 [Paraglomus brasilianum]
MDFEKEIAHYLQTVNHSKWNVEDILRYLSENIEFSSESATEIEDHITQKLRMIADDPNALQAARRKAFKLFTSIKTIFERRPEIKQIFESQDLKYSENYSQNVETTVQEDHGPLCHESAQKSRETTPPPIPLATEVLLTTPHKRPLENENVQRFTDKLPLICAFGMTIQQLEETVGRQLAS